MTDKNIKIGITTTANTSGAKQAEDALKGLKNAGEETTSASEANAALMKAAGEEHAAAMAKAREASEELFEGLGKISEGLEGVADAGEEANEQGAEMDENVRKITQAQKAQALAQLAESVGQIGGKFKEAAAEVEQFDKEAAASLRQTGERVEQVTGAVSQLALGFAVGGPVGAGVAALAISVGALVNAFMESEVGAIKAAAAQEKAMADAALATRDAARAARERADELARDDIEAGIRRQNEAIADGLSLIREQTTEARKRRQEEERILSAQDKLDIAQIDEQEAKGEITPEQAGKSRAGVEQGAVQRKRAEEKKRAEEDAADARAESDKQLQAFAEAEEAAQAARERVAQREAEVVAAQRTVAGGKAQAERLALEMEREEEDSSMFPNYETQMDIYRRQMAKQKEIDSAGFTARELATPPEAAAADLAAAEKALADEKNALDAARAAVDSQAKIGGKALAAADKAEKERDRTVSTVDAVAVREDTARAARERAMQAREEAAQKAKDDAAAAQARRDEQLAIEREGRGIPGTVEGFTSGARGIGVTRDVEEAAARLKDGATADEYGGLAAAMESFVEASQSVSQNRRAEMQALATTVRNLGERLRRVEGK